MYLRDQAMLKLHFLAGDRVSELAGKDANTGDKDPALGGTANMSHLGQDLLIGYPK